MSLWTVEYRAFIYGTLVIKNQLSTCDPQSPDFSVSGFFVWGLKLRVCGTKRLTLDELEVGIGTAAITEIDRALLFQRVGCQY